MASQCFGCDLGSSSIKIYSQELDTILVQKNMVAIEERRGMIAYGDHAFEMYEKAPANIEVLRPMSLGTVASITHLQDFLVYYLEDHAKSSLKGAEFYMAVPTGVQDRVFTTLVQGMNLKSRVIKMVDKPVACGLGLGLDVTSAEGVMIVDIGADTTEISILSLGGMVTSKLIKSGGSKMDDSIAGAIRREYGYFIGQKTAEGLKKELGFLPESEHKHMTICGRNMALGLPAMLDVDGAFVADALKDHMKTIVDAIKMILEHTPPELGVDIIRNGIYLTGGVANLKGLPELIAANTGIRVNEVEKPEECVARGLARVIKNKEFRRLAYTTKEQNYI